MSQSYSGQVRGIGGRRGNSKTGVLITREGKRKEAIVLLRVFNMPGVLQMNEEDKAMKT